MPLETGNYIQDLSESNPPGADSRSQGDDHIRLVKAILKTTFPNATKAFRFPTTAAEAAGNVIVTFPDHQNKLFPVNATVTGRIVTLPDPTSGGTVNEDGFQIAVIKTDSSSNPVTITPSGVQTINGAASLVLSKQWDIAVLVWAGTDDEWYALYTPAEASETIKGVVERATDAEAAAGSDTSRYLTPAQLHEARADVASGSTTDIGGAASNFVRITGTTTITSLGSAAAGVWRDVTFEGALTLTHHASNLIIPGGANIVTAANDRMRVRSLGSGAWIVLQYTKASGKGLLTPAETYVEETDVLTTTNTIAHDNTAPQISEGEELLSGAITIQPTSAVDIAISIPVLSINNNLAGTVAVFIAGTNDAINATVCHPPTGNAKQAASIHFTHTPGSAGPHTYSVRFGPTGSTMTVNGVNGAGIFGAGVTKSSMRLREVFAP